MIVGFAGTRSGPTPAQHNAMRAILRRLSARMVRFVHGGAKGCDTLAHNIVAAVPGIVIEIHPADRDKSVVVMMPHAGWEIDVERPALDRNRTVVSRIHGLVAVPRTDQGADSGTWATIRYARSIGCPVLVIRQDGSFWRGWQ
jgi:predicted Rossmann fold nucleotide-binding protein DprA/Smf involved in DNA uptake